MPTLRLQGFRVFFGNFAVAKSIPLQICLKYHPCLRLTLQSRRQIESNKSPLPCSLCALALNTGKPPVRTNRGSLFFPTAGTFRPRLGSMEFGFCGLRSVGRYGADRPSPAFSCAALYFCYSNKVCSARMPQRTGTNTAANMTRKADI